MNYSIGLDIGITSVGSASVLLNSKDEPCKILRLSSRIFEAAENPDGSPLSAPRRNNRGMRRRLRRKHFRKERIKELIANKIMPAEDINNIYLCKDLKDIYEIRSDALDKKLSKEDFVRLLINLSQRRGFKSNRKVDGKDSKSESGKLLTAVKTNQSLLSEKGYRTIGEMLYKDKRFSKNKRNKSEDYSNTFARSDYENEIKLIFSCQRNFGNEYATEDFEEKYLNIYLSQRSFDAGPGGNSPYGGNQIEKMLGYCTFEKDELRAVKASFSFEYFNLLSKVNAVKIITADNTKRPITKEERDLIISTAFSKDNINYGTLRKALKLSDNEMFNISYKEDDCFETEKKTKFTYLNSYHIFKKAYGECFNSWNINKKNALAYALTVFKNDKKIIDYLDNAGFEKVEIDIALELPSFSKTGNLSIKALNKIIPYLEEGMLYNEACEKAGYNFKADNTAKQMYLPANPNVAPELGEIRNPVVRRAVSQTIKVINSIIREYGESPTFVNIELARNLSKNFKERDKIKKAQKDNHANNERLMEELKTNFGVINPTGQDLVKYKLWKEQDGICPYSQEPIALDRLFEIGYTDIDHIIPYSISFDDTYNNKVLVLSKENRQKGNRIPLNYLQGERAENFIVWVENSNLRYFKKKNLLKESLTDDDLSGFKKRNLQDTQYISRFMLNFLKKYLLLTPNNTGRKNTIVSVNGAATAYIRKRWGINKIRENGDVHHAVDAVVIACVTQGMIKRISEYSKYSETKYVHPETGQQLDLNRATGELTNRFPTPYQTFRDELDMLCCNDPARVLHEKPLVNYSTDEALSPIFVSRMSNHKVTGLAHEATIRKPYEENGESYTISKVPLSKLKLKNGEIENYYNPSSDVLLYNALKDRLLQFGGKGSNAFKEPFYKPKSNGTQGPLVKKVKIIKKATSTVRVQQNTAVARNSPMVRVDVFCVENDGYYLVPIYVSDTVKDKLPNKAIVPDKPYAEWKEMDEDNFIFSIYKNDLIRVVNKKKDMLLYYKSTNIHTASISGINHDNTYTIEGLGVKRLLLMEKYNVDVLGNVHKVQKEKRMGFK